MNHFQEIANFIWSIADEILRDDFKRGKYPDVILPFTVLRRLDCVLAPTKEKVLKRNEDLKPKGLENMDGQLRRAAGHSFYNLSSSTSRSCWTTRRTSARISAPTSTTSRRTCGT